MTAIAETEHSVIDAREEVITSKMAAQWLEKYEGPNRRTSEIRVLQYQSDMENGRWHFNGQDALVFSNENRLLNGKHRLTALANIPDPGLELRFLVVRGVDADAQLTMDQGGARTVGQQLSLKGMTNSATVASATKFYLDWTRGRLFKSTQRASTTKPEATEWALGHRDLLGKLFDTPFARVDAPASVVGAFALATLQFAPARTHKFLHQLSSGTGYGEGDPILALDRRLRAIRRTNVKVSQREYLAYFIRAWNAWVSANRLQKIQVGRLSDENFPDLLRVSDLEERAE